MVPETLTRQIVQFQKASFDQAFNTAVMVQDQTERWLKTLVEQSTWLPSEGQRLADEWARLYRRSRTDLKQALDQAYEKLDALFGDGAHAETPKPKKPTA